MHHTFESITTEPDGTTVIVTKDGIRFTFDPQASAALCNHLLQHLTINIQLSKGTFVAGAYPQPPEESNGQKKSDQTFP